MQRTIGLVAALAAASACAACATTGAVPRPFPVPNGPDVPGRSTPTAAARPATAARGALEGYAVTGTALSLRGAPYRNGGADPAGFDCSGFTQYVFAQHGVRLPREVREQYRLGKSVKTSELSPGDLVFFSTTETGASHVAIALGADEFVHAPSSTGVVRVERLTSNYWQSRYVGARRLN